MTQILSIEDDNSVQLSLRELAKELGMNLLVVSDGFEGLKIALETELSLVTVDLGLPGLGGIEICRRLRAAKPKLPIVIITSRNDELSKVLGLELGADDYVSKPFDLDVLVARIRSIFRRRQIPVGEKGGQKSSRLQLGQLSLDLEKREAKIGDAEVNLSRTEFDLLSYLTLRDGAVVGREELANHIWGYYAEDLDAILTTYLSRVRQKLDVNPECGKLIATVRGVGYRIQMPDSK